jgi:hypothetical protein
VYQFEALRAPDSGGRPHHGSLVIGTVSTTTVAPKLNMHVEKAGRTTGLTSGSIDTLNFTALVGYSPCGSTSVHVVKGVSQRKVAMSAPV